ncbi:hypothetical protein [Geodermatophilus sp. URMC 64]
MDQLAAAAPAFADFHAHHHTVARILNYELAALSDEQRAEIDALRKGIDDELRDLVGAGVAASVFHTSDPALAATSLAAMGIDIARCIARTAPGPRADRRPPRRAGPSDDGCAGVLTAPGACFVRLEPACAATWERRRRRRYPRPRRDRGYRPR